MRGVVAILTGLVGVMPVTLVSAVHPALAEQRCMVTDPTDTPLNIRRTPGGDIVGTYDNGTILRVTRREVDGQGRDWALVGELVDGEVRVAGWVFGRYLRCF